jgi:signal transduction histidine kinase
VRLSIFWRVYLNGFILLFVTGLAIAAAGAAYGRGHADRAARAVRYAALRVAELHGEPRLLEAELRQEREAFDHDLTVYRDGALLASTVSPPLPPLSAQEIRALGSGPARHAGRGGLAAPVEGLPGAYVILRGVHPPLPTVLLGLALGLVLLAALSLPLTHALTAPLARVTRAARAFGSGDMRARAGSRGGGEVGELSHAFDDMAERLEAMVLGERELLANVSHELRTPLARIRVALDLAAEGELVRSRRYLGEIDTDVGELERLIDDVLAASRLEAAARQGGAIGLPPRLERLAPSEVLADAARRFRELHPERELRLDLASQLPPFQGSRPLLQRVLANLLENADKYSGAGRPLRLGARALAEAIEFEVRDDGIGIATEDLPRLFTPFFRGEHGPAREQAGTGLGLVLARRIVEAHGGRITVESAPERGTTVRFALPLPAEA